MSGAGNCSTGRRHGQAFAAEDQEVVVEDVNDNMEGHASFIDFILEEFDELVHEEEQTEEAQLQHVLQQRLCTSLASRWCSLAVRLYISMDV
jgi:hypothetical protein